MTSPILESMERPIANHLLEIASIYAKYGAFRNRWTTYFITTFESNKILVPPGSGDFGEVAPIFTPREHSRNHIIVVATYSESLLSDIRGLESDQKDLYGRIERLNIKGIKFADIKGLFLLFAKAVEDYDASVSNGQVDG